MEAAVTVPEILFIPSSVVPQVLELDAVIARVETAYVALSRGEVSVAPIQHLENTALEGEIDIKSGLVLSPRAYVSVKVASGFYRNEERGLPTGLATLVLLDGETGLPLAVMNAGQITEWRTGAAAAVAARHLSRPDAVRAAMIGAGAVARMSLRALCRVRPLTQAWVWAPPVEMREGFARDLGAELGLPVQAVASPGEAVAEADIVVTATPSREPIITPGMVRPGTHISAMGADGPGKQELAAALLASSKVVVDRLEQCLVAGELQHPVNGGLMKPEDVHAEIGQVISGDKPARADAWEITIFDATGTAAQDIMVAALVYEEARRRGLGVTVAL